MKNVVFSESEMYVLKAASHREEVSRPLLSEGADGKKTTSEIEQS